MADQTVDLEALRDAIETAKRNDDLVHLTEEDAAAYLAALERIPELEEVLRQKQPALEASIAERQRLEDALAAAREALANLVTAIEPESEGGCICIVCSCSMPEFDEPHAPDCAYLAARHLAGLPEIGQPDYDGAALAREATDADR